MKELLHRSLRSSVFRILILGIALHCQIQAKGLPVQSVMHTDLKVAYLLKMTKFVNYEMSGWSKLDTLKFCFRENDPMADLARESYPKERVASFKLEIQEIKTPQEIKTCQVAYFSPEKEEREVIRPFLQIARQYPILTANEDDWFTDDGGVLRFYINQLGQLRFEINFTTVTKSGLRLSSQLLRLARIKR
jgi:hypothetical protein